MKTTLALFILAILALARAGGQSSQSPDPGRVATNQPSQADLLNLAPNLPPEKLRGMVRFQTSTVMRILGVEFEVDGVLPRLRRADHPLHLINPLAPSQYGTGLETLSLNPRTHQVEGISFLTLRF